MSAAPYIFGGLVIGGGIVLLLRNREAKLAETTHEDDPCEALKDVNATAYDACRAAKAGLGLVGSVTSWLGNAVNYGAQNNGKWDRENIALNGEIELPLDDKLRDVLWGGRVGTSHRALNGSVLRFKNGGVPFKGFPGWEKCAPGTHDMLSTAEGLQFVARGFPSGGSDGKQPAIVDKNGKPQAHDNYAGGSYAKAFTGEVGDPFTFPVLRGPIGMAGQKFDYSKAVYTGTYYVGGKKVTCSGGTVIERAYIKPWGDVATGTRTALYKCAPPGKTFQEVWGGGPANTLPNGDFGDFGQHEADGMHIQVSPTDRPGYHLVPATSLVPEHWERDR